MSRLDKLPHIINQQLSDVRMSDSLKDRVRQGIAAKGATPRPFYTRPGLMAGVALACACLALLLVYAPLRPQPENQVTTPAVTQAATIPASRLGAVTVTAQSESKGGVAVSTAFVIETGDPALTAEQLGGGLSVTPHIDYNLTPQGDGQFLLTPLDALEMGTVYQIAMTGLSSPETNSPGDLSWAFQTESRLALVSTLPADSTSWANVDTGIEMTFSRPIATAEGQVSISPQIPGRLEYYDHTVVFVPQGGLNPDTVYTVTLSPELSAATGESLGESVSFSFRTSSSGGAPTFYLIGALTESFLPDDPVVVEMVSDNYWDDVQIPVTVSVYSLSGDDYSRLAGEQAAALHPRLGRSSDVVLDTNRLALLYTYEDSLVSANYRYYAVLPENPGAGYYLVDIRPAQEQGLGNMAIQKLVCVSDLSVYVLSQNGQAVVWVNDAATGQPLGGAQVDIALPEAAALSASTDSGGLAQLDISAAQAATLPMTIRAADGREWHDRVYMDTQAVRSASEIYQACLYFDRAAYLPTDTIHFWGVVRARDGSAALPQRMTLAFGTLPQQTLELDEHGMFTGSISYENLISTWMYVQLMVGEDSLVGTGIQVMAYTKPAYVLTLKADRAYYRQGETATILTTAAFFDGTPAAGLELRVGDADSATRGTTDASGHITHTQGFAAYWGGTWHPGGRYISAQTTGQEDAGVYQYIYPTYFSTDYMQQLELTELDSGWQLSATSHEIDFDAVDAWLAEHPGEFSGEDFEAAIRGTGYSQDFTVEVVQTRWIKRVTGEQYDFINKKVVPTYTYDSRQSVVDTFTLSSVDGQGLSGLLTYRSAPDCYYTLHIRYTTPDGVAMDQSFSLGDYWFYGYDSAIKSYYLYSQDYQFTENGTVTATLTENSSPVDMTGRMLYLVSQQDILYYLQTASDTLVIDCDARHIPGFMLTAAYFDGRHIYPVRTLWRSFDYSQRQLDVEITPHKASYAPGDTATVDIRLTQPDGTPVEADFVLSVVDEAAFAVQDQYINLLGQLYSYSYRSPQTFASYVQHSMEDGAYAEEGGEGDAEGFRQDFMDTAAFIAGRTGADGTATLTFRLADNLTAWRITCAAVTQAGWAGQGTHKVPATLPFFVNVVRNEKYITGDSVVLSARGAGMSVSPADKVAYQASISGAGLADTLSTTAMAGEYAYFNFGKLPAGEYTVELTALCGELRDAVRYTVLVVDSRLEVPVTTVAELGDLLALESARYPVTLTFFDPNLTEYMTGAFGLAGLYGQRGDQRLARTAANALLNSLGLERDAEADLSGVQLWDGGVAIYSYGDSDPGLTAYALAACPNLIDSRAAKSYLYAVLYDRSSAKEAVAYAYLGLAASGEPVLLDLRAQLGAQEDLSWNLPLALGLSLLGDQATAYKWYEAAVAPLLQPYGEHALYLDAPGGATGDVTYTRAELTAQAAALAACLGHGDSTRLLGYLRQSGTLAGNALPALLALTARPAPPVTGETVLTFTVDGSPIQVRLTPEKPLYTVLMNKSQLEDAGFSVQSGQAAVAVQWVGGAEALVNPLPQDRFSVTKRYEQASGGRIAVRISVSVNTQLGTATDSLYEGYYTLTDVLPSGLRFVSAPYSNYGGWYLSDEEGGRVSFDLDTRRWSDGVVTHRQSFEIIYYARPALPGEFVAESTVLQHPASGGSLSSARGGYTSP